MRATRCFTTALVFLTIASFAFGAWTETNNDGGPGQLDYDNDWVAVYNGSTPNPVTSWSKATNPPASNFGSDPGWIDNVIRIADPDTTAFAAANRVEVFDKVRVTVACTTADPNEEFGPMAHINDFTSITDVDGYAATFSANNAANLGDPLKFTLYKFENGVPTVELVANPARPVVDDLIFWIELIADDGHITARLYEDTGDTVPMAELGFDDTTPLPAGYSGVLALDYDPLVADPYPGMDAFYDTLVSGIPEPGTMALLIAGLLFGLFSPRRRR